MLVMNEEVLIVVVVIAKTERFTEIFQSFSLVVFPFNIAYYANSLAVKAIHS